MENIWILLAAIVVGFVLIALMLLRLRPVKEDETGKLALMETQSQLKEASSRLHNSELEIKRLETQEGFLEEKLSQALAEVTQSKSALEQSRSERQELSEEIIRLQSSLKEERQINQERQRTAEENLRLLKEEQDKIQQKMNIEFQNMAQKILEKNSENLQQQSKKDIGLVLDPLKNQLNEFSKLVNETNKEAAVRNQDLKNELKHINDAALQMSKEASDLTNSLKGQAKIRGNWGEMVLERSLELSGLRKDHEYSLEEAHRDDDGNLVRPDAIVKLPGDRAIIIDSKLSLIAYNNYINCEDEEEKQGYLNAHLEAVKTHIKQLSSKNYHDLQDLHNPDFVVMFVPLESALMLALEQDPNLAEEALQKNIGIASPSTIMMVLRTIEHLWRSERQIENAEKISKRGGMLYDKFVNFVDSLNSVQKNVVNTNTALNKAFSQLSGNGGLIRQAEQLSELGVKGKKQLGTKTPEPVQLEDNSSS